MSEAAGVRHDSDGIVDGGYWCIQEAIYTFGKPNCGSRKKVAMPTWDGTKMPRTGAWTLQMPWCVSSHARLDHSCCMHSFRIHSVAISIIPNSWCGQNAWCTLTDCTAAHGPMEHIRGSHLQPLMEHVIIPSALPSHTQATCFSVRHTHTHTQPFCVSLSPLCHCITVSFSVYRSICFSVYPSLS